MMGLFYSPPYGKCTVCGRVTELSTGEMEAKQTDHGEEFERNYCCKNCLSDHGPTPHVRVNRHGEEMTLEEAGRV